MEEKKKLLKSGLELSDVLIQYLSKDAMGSSFLKNYLSTLDSQADAGQRQEEALQKLIDSSRAIDTETKGMAVKAGENNERLSQIYESVESLRESVERIEKEHRQYMQHFTTLLAQTKEINTLIDAIQDISAQTNLLSFNASIEAARAGVAGKGFRIIANEVKKLSEDTNKTSETIKSKVTDLVNSISELEKSTKTNSSALEGLAVETGNTLDKFDNVRRINSENNTNVGAISDRVNDSIQNITRMIETIRKSDEGTKSAVEQFAKSASENELLFNDLYSFAHQIKAIFKELVKDSQ